MSDSSESISDNEHSDTPVTFKEQYEDEFYDKKYLDEMTDLDGKG